MPGAPDSSVRDLVKRKAAADIADHCGALPCQGECIRDETSELVKSFDPTQTVVLGDEDRPGKELAEVDYGNGTADLL